MDEEIVCEGSDSNNFSVKVYQTIRTFPWNIKFKIQLDLHRSECEATLGVLHIFVSDVTDGFLYDQCSAIIITIIIHNISKIRKLGHH